MYILWKENCNLLSVGNLWQLRQQKENCVRLSILKHIFLNLQSDTLLGPWLINKTAMNSNMKF